MSDGLQSAFWVFGLGMAIVGALLLWLRDGQ